ncbi:unnamed protein product, partial [Ixodes hexagonus]
VNDVAEHERRGNSEQEDEQVGHVRTQSAKRRGPLCQQLAEVGQLGVCEGRVALAAKGLPDGVVVAHQHSLLVGEGVEAVLAVVATHAARPHSAKGERVDKGVVGAHASAGRLLHEAVNHFLRLGKHIQCCPLPSPLIDELNRLVRTLHPQDRQHWAKNLDNTDLFLHDGICGLDVREQCGCHILGVFIHLSAHGWSGAIQQLGYSPAKGKNKLIRAPSSLDVIGVDDAPQVRAGLWVLRVELRDDLLARVHKVRVGRLVAQHVVWSHAGLSRIDVLAPDETPAGHVQIQAFVQVHRAAMSPFATQLQRDRRQLLLRRGVDDLANVDGARVKDVVKLLRQELRGLLGSSRHDGVAFLQRVLGNHFLYDLGRGGRILRGLDHRTVSSCNGADQRAQRQLHRIVPGSNDECHPVRLAVHHRFIHYQHDVLRPLNCATYLFGFHPFVQLHECAFDLIAGEVDLKQDTLKLVLEGQFLFESLHERIMIVLEKPVQSLELLDSVARGAGLAQLERTSQLIDTL